MTIAFYYDRIKSLRHIDLKLFSASYASFFERFKNPRITAPTIEPTKIATKYMNQFPITGKTKIPPCGAGNVQPKIIVNAPATAEPMTHEGITFNGSAAANGIAPSVMNDNPMI